MDYEIGSIADLISGNHTPNRRKVAKKPLTPVKLPPSSNVTPQVPEEVKSRTPKLAFTPETSGKFSTKKKSPQKGEFDSPKSIPKKRKSKLFNNFQFLSQLPDHESGNESFGEGSDAAEGDDDASSKKKKKHSKEDAKKVIKEYFVSKAEINGNQIKSKKEKNKQKNEEIKNDDISPKNKKKHAQSETVDSSKKRKEKKNKKNKTNINDEEDSNINTKKKKNKQKSESENVDFNTNSGTRDSGTDNDSDNEIPMSDNEMNINAANEELEDGAESEDDAQEAPLTDFQKAASRRIEKKLMRDEKFSPEEIEKTLFVGNIPVSVLSKNHEKVLKKKFSPYGGIESVRIRNIPLADFKTKPKVALIEKKFHTERTTVIAYIKFRNPVSVGKALVENNSILDGNHIRVDRCYQQKKVQVDSRKTIFLGNLPFSIEEEELRSMFQNCGPIMSVRIVRDRQTQIGKGIGFINFEKSDGVELAMSMGEEDLLIKKKTIRVQRYNASNKKDNKGKRQNPRDNKVVGKRYQKFHQQQSVNNEQPKSYGKKRDEQGNKKRKRNLEGYVNGNEKRNKKEREGNEESKNEKPLKKFKKNNEEFTGNNTEKTEEKPVANVNENPSENTENGTEERKPYKKDRSIDYKGLIAKKKKKLKLNKAILKKKKISKILLHDANKSK